MDRILCPYCPDGVPMRMSMGGTSMRCPKCRSTSPVIDDVHTAVTKREEIVRAAARRRYVPPMMLEQKWRGGRER